MAQSTVRLIVDAQNAIRPLQRVNQQTQTLSKSTDKLKGRLDRSNRSFREQGKSAKVAAGGVQTLTRSLAPLLKALAVAATARFIFVKTAELETQRKSLEVLTGSLEKTNKIIKELQAFGSLTPFTSSELIEQTKRLKAFGFETSELVDTTKRLSEIAGATGADLQGIATAFGQIRAKGKLQQEENLQLLERGVDITTELKRITGLQGDAFAEAMRKGEIGADLVNQAMINLTNEGGAFFGGATKQADTLNGQLSTLVDNVETLARTIGDFLSPVLKQVFTETNKVLSAINRLFASEFQRDISKLRLNLEIPSGTKKDLDEIKNFVDNIPTEGVNLVNIDLFRDQLQGTSKQLQNVASEIQKTRPFGLTNAEIEAFEQAQGSILAKLQELEKVRKRITSESEKSEKIESKILEKNVETLTVNDLFNQSLLETGFLVENLSLGSDKFAESLFAIKSEADILKEKFMEIGQGIEQGIVSNLTDAVMGTKSLADAAISVLDDLKRKLIELAIQRTVSGIGNFFGKALGGLFGGGGGGKSGGFFGGGGGGLVPFMPSLGGKGFAEGGRPPVGKASLVGERGPELFVPSRAGTIIPNNKLGGGTTNNIVVNVNVEGNVDAQGGEEEGRQLGSLIAVAVQNEIIKQQRPNGLLSR